MLHPSRFTWSASQRLVLLVLLTVLLVSLVARYALNTMYVSDPQPETPARFDELADKIDPNTANWETLAAVPGLGQRRARDIVDFRQRKRDLAHDPNLVVFHTGNDLLFVRGVGVATVDNLKPYLLFPATLPATRPAPHPVTDRSATAPAL